MIAHRPASAASAASAWWPWGGGLPDDLAPHLPSADMRSNPTSSLSPPPRGERAKWRPLHPYRLTGTFSLAGRSCVSSRNARFLYGIGGRLAKGQGGLAEPPGGKRPRAASGVTPDPVFASRAPCLNSRRGVGSVRGARRFDSPAAAFVVVNGLFEIRVLLARKEAELVENGEMLLGLGQVTQYEIRL